MTRLKDKVIMITGSSEGIGREMVRLFAREGARVVAVARRAEALQALAAEAGAEQVLAAPGDVTSFTEMQQVTARALERWGRIDALVNNAGVAKYVPLTEMSPEEFQWQMDVNLTGVFNATKAVLPHLLERAAAEGRRPVSGQVLNISSVLGVQAIPRGTAYCATKFGLMGFTECLRMEVQEQGIRVMVLCPGLVQTDFGGRPASVKSTGLLPGTVAGQALNMLAAPPDALPSTLILRPSVS